MVYVLVPAHNEARTVGLLLWKVRQLFSAFGREYHLIVLDDASTDGTADVLAPYARALPMTLVTHRRRLGFGACLEELLALAVERSDRPRRDIAITLQADLSEATDVLPEMVKRMEGGADIVVADTRRSVQDGPGAALLRRLLAPLVRSAAGLSGVDDPLSTLRAYRLAPVARMLREGRPSHPGSDDVWAASLAALVRAARHARRIETVPASPFRSLRQRPSRARLLRSAWAAWRAAAALGGRSGGLDGPPAAGAPAQEPAREAAAGEQRSAQGGRRRARARGRGRGRARGGDSRAARPPA
jgi:hypothetical protein